MRKKFPWRLLRLSCSTILYLFCFCSVNGWADKAKISPVTLTSVNVLRATPEYAEVEIAGSYDGSLGVLTLASTNENTHDRDEAWAGPNWNY